MHDLALQVREVDCVVVYQGDFSDAGRSEIERRWRTQAAGADDQGVRGEDAALSLNAEGVELNQRYASVAIVEEPDAAPEVFERDRELYVQATTRPGAKLPHAWLVNEEHRRVSTLDVTGNGMISLVTGLSGAAWVDAVTKLDKDFLQPVVIGSPGAQDLYGNWNRVSQMPEGGALLVRPDGFIAWRHSEPVTDPDEAYRLVKSALTQILGRD